MLDPSAESYKTHLSFPSNVDDRHDSGVCSPPLWRSSPPTSPHGRSNNYRSLSPSSKAKAIARGQQELMDMVSKMPESCYELTLKDLVEANRNAEERKVFDETPQRSKRPSGAVKKSKSDKWAENNRKESINRSGLLLKMVFPVNLASKKRTKRKKNEEDVYVKSKSSQVSPRPSISEGHVKTEDEDWWKKGFSGSGGSESGVSSNNSGSTKSNGSGGSSNSQRSRSSERYFYNS